MLNLLEGLDHACITGSGTRWYETTWACSNAASAPANGDEAMFQGFVGTGCLLIGGPLLAVSDQCVVVMSSNMSFVCQATLAQSWPLIQSLSRLTVTHCVTASVHESPARLSSELEPTARDWPLG